MSLKIDQDHGRFRAIVRGKIRENLRRYVSKGELMGKQGKERVSIPIPQIDIPRFRFADKQQGGVGQGDGEPGDGVGQGQGKPGEGAGEAGQGEGEHALEVEVTLDELADILGEEEVRKEFLSDVHGFAKTYESPAFAREEKNLIKLKAFFDAKLPK